MDTQLICDAIRATGATVPCDSALFLSVLLIHVPLGLTCVVVGLVAMLSRKGSGRHPSAGTIYYWALSAVFVTATALSAMRWAEDWHLFVLGALSFAAASFGRMAHRQRWHSWVRLHITGMGSSYILLLTAFYVDNGKNLPLWKELPAIAYWVLPSAVGIPLIVYALLNHPLVRSRRGSVRAAGG
ncbi:MAG: DUF2306 domain-containing protein [Chloroflexi bacterium]|nr:DUF2306 domain-containing protein [Chloroflexota bacterium]